MKILLGLVLEGAAGDSAKQLRHALRLDNEDQATAQLHKFQLSLQVRNVILTNHNLTSRSLR